MDIQLYLYHRKDCHLCDQAWALIESLGLSPLTKRVNIDDDPRDAQRYCIRIPVLKNSAGVEINWPFHAQQIKELINL